MHDMYVCVCMYVTDIQYTYFLKHDLVKLVHFFLKPGYFVFLSFVFLSFLQTIKAVFINASLCLSWYGIPCGLWIANKNIKAMQITADAIIACVIPKMIQSQSFFDKV